MTTLNNKDKKKFTVKLLCQTLHVSKHAFVNAGHNKSLCPTNTVLIDEIKSIIGSTRKYGYRRITIELKHRGFCINHKKVLKIMKTNNLLCKTKKMFKSTTNSNHNLIKYPNLLETFVPSFINQVWASDITYVTLNNSFIYLAVVLDLFSRKVIGWSISKHIDDNLVVAALNMALTTRDIPDGLIHHSDQGVQYASYAYTNILKQNNIQISMSRKGNPYDNAFLERFMRTIKQEEIYMNEYDDITDAVLNIGNFIENVYNKKRLHSSIGYVSPNDFEFALSSVSIVSNSSVPR